MKIMKTGIVKPMILFTLVLVMLQTSLIPSYSYFPPYYIEDPEIEDPVESLESWQPTVHYYGGERLYHFGFISGSGKDTMILNEDQYFTREQLAIVILQIMGLKQEAQQKNLTPDFKDLKDISVWARPFVAYCKEKNLMSGSGGIFNPKKPITGKELGAVLLRVLGYSDVEWNDVEKKLEELKIPAYPWLMRRGLAFNYIWRAITLPITSDGQRFALKSGKVKAHELSLIKYENFRERLVTADESRRSPYFPSIVPLNGLWLVEYDNGRIELYNDKLEFVVGDKRFPKKTVLQHLEFFRRWRIVNKYILNFVALDYTGKEVAISENFRFLGENMILSGRYLLNMDLQPISDLPSDRIGNFQEGVATIRVHEKYGLIDKSGQVIADTIYDDIDDFREGVAIVKKNGKYGLIDKSGQVVVKDTVYDYIKHFYQGFFIIKRNNKYGVIDKTGQVVVDTVYNRIDPLPGGVARFYKEDEQGFRILDKTGKTLAGTLYRFYEGPYVGLKDHTNRIILDPLYSRVDSNRRNMIAAEKKGYWALFNLQGKPLSDFVYEEIEWKENGFAAAKRNGHWTIFDQYGKQLTHFECDRIYLSHYPNLIFAKKEDECVILNFSGNILGKYKFSEFRELEYPEDFQRIIDSEGQIIPLLRIDNMNMCIDQNGNIKRYTVDYLPEY